MIKVVILALLVGFSLGWIMACFAFLPALSDRFRRALWFRNWVWKRNRKK